MKKEFLERSNNYKNADVVFGTFIKGRKTKLIIENSLDIYSNKNTIFLGNVKKDQKNFLKHQLISNTLSKKDVLIYVKDDIFDSVISKAFSDNEDYEFFDIDEKLLEESVYTLFDNKKDYSVFFEECKRNGIKSFNIDKEKIDIKTVSEEINSNDFVFPENIVELNNPDTYSCIVIRGKENLGLCKAYIMTLLRKKIVTQEIKSNFIGTVSMRGMPIDTIYYDLTNEEVYKDDETDLFKYGYLNGLLIFSFFESLNKIKNLYKKNYGSTWRRKYSNLINSMGNYVIYSSDKTSSEEILTLYGGLSKGKNGNKLKNAIKNKLKNTIKIFSYKKEKDENTNKATVISKQLRSNNSMINKTSLKHLLLICEKVNKLDF